MAKRPSIRGVHYISDNKLTWSRQKRGTGFQYLDEKNKPLSNKRVERIKKLAIPPAWKDVKICPNEKGHIQATGLDEKGRKQYIYHSGWVAYNQQNKFDYMIRFGEVLPVLRETVASHMRQHNLTKERILATIVWLLENTFIRIGNRTYQKENKSYGLTTLREKHVKVKGNKVTFSFKGKSGVFHELDVTHPRIAQTIKKCIELPGYEMFNYLDEDKKRHRVDSRDVNEYLQQITGEDMSAKDFRTWGGTTIAGTSLYEVGDPESEDSAKGVINSVVERVAEHLGNTVAVCRQYYIHPKIFLSYQKKKLVPHFHQYHTRRKPRSGHLSPGEKATWTLLKLG